jgi:predicted MFS family arabinose efflux permease
LGLDDGSTGAAGCDKSGLAEVSLSLNSSAIYVGSAIGSGVGAIVIACGLVEQLGLAAAGLTLPRCYRCLFFAKARCRDSNTAAARVL